jgi:hypothetical protein
MVTMFINIPGYVTALFLLLVWVHTIADFVFQSDKMAINKSSSWKWLSIHVGMYGLLLLPLGWKFTLVNCLLHFITDAVSSRVTTYFWKKEQRHKFFVTIGIDQAIHMSCLFLTIPLIQ